MATATIGQLTLAASALDADIMEFEIAASGLSRRITKKNFIGATLTGLGTIATGGNSLTIGGASSINGAFVGNLSGGGTIVTAGFTGTLPNSGTFSLLGLAQTYSALRTFGAGLTFGVSTLANYDESQTPWTPTVVGATGTPVGRAYSQQTGRYTRIGNVVFFSAWITVTTVGSGDSGDARFSLPIQAASGLANALGVNVQTSGVDIPGTPISLLGQIASGSSYLIVQGTQDNASAGGAVQISGLANGDTIIYNGFYFV